MKGDENRPRSPETEPHHGLHEIQDVVRQLSYMEKHCTLLLDTLARRIEATDKKAPVGRRAKGQTYELSRTSWESQASSGLTDQRAANGGERALEQRIWRQWSGSEVVQPGKHFLNGVCTLIQTYQLPLQEFRKDRGWGKIDLVGVTPQGLPVVIELKQEGAQDTLLRMLVEAVAYACALRKAWNDGRPRGEDGPGLRREWIDAMTPKNVLLDAPDNLVEVPVILLAPAGFWTKRIGEVGKRSRLKVPDAVWPKFVELVRQCEQHGFPVYFVQFEDKGGEIVNVSEVTLPEKALDGKTWIRTSQRQANEGLYAHADGTRDHRSFMGELIGEEL